jgi:uncharacterized OB-fold protein
MTYQTDVAELPRGVRILANILNCEPGDVRIGMPVKVC